MYDRREHSGTEVTSDLFSGKRKGSNTGDTRPEVGIKGPYSDFQSLHLPVFSTEERWRSVAHPDLRDVSSPTRRVAVLFVSLPPVPTDERPWGRTALSVD